jgi:hypothetical protein
VGRGVTGAGFFGACLTKRFVSFGGITFFGAAFAGTDFAFFVAVFLATGFLLAACSAFAASARFSAHLLLVAATIAALPALLSLRLAFGASGVFHKGAQRSDARLL